MAWTSPTTRITGELITATIYNETNKDNQDFLHQRVVSNLYSFNESTDTSATVGAWRSPRVSNTGTDTVWFSFSVPSDFSAISTLKVLLHPATNTTYDYDVEVSYGAEGESATNHSATATNQTFSTTIADEIVLIDITSLVGSLAADDFVAVAWSASAGAGANRQYPHAVFFEYTRT